MANLTLISEFVPKYFNEGSHPSRATVRRWIRNGTLPGRQIGGNFYVDEAAWLARENRLLTKILSHGTSAK